MKTSIHRVPPSFIGTNGPTRAIAVAVVIVAVLALVGILLFQQPQTMGLEQALMSAPPRAGSVVEKESMAKDRPSKDLVPATPAVVASVKPLCAHCGTVIAVTAVEREGAASGLGAVAGGVLGALVGNQIGSGSGRTATTVLGAVGGGWAGNTAEKKMKKVLVYQIRMQMDDGSSRMVEQMSSFAVGEKVIIEGNALRRNDGSLSSPMPVQPGSLPAAPSAPAGAG